MCSINKLLDCEGGGGGCCCCCFGGGFVCVCARTRERENTNSCRRQNRGVQLQDISLVQCKATVAVNFKPPYVTCSSLTYIFQEMHIYLLCICYFVETRIYRLFKGMVYLRKYGNMRQHRDRVLSDVYCNN